MEWYSKRRFKYSLLVCHLYPNTKVPKWHESKNKYHPLIWWYVPYLFWIHMPLKTEHLSFLQQKPTEESNKISWKFKLLATNVRDFRLAICFLQHSLCWSLHFKRKSSTWIKPLIAQLAYIWYRETIFREYQ